MPQKRRNSGTKAGNGKSKSDIGLGAIVYFVEFIGVLCGALGALSLVGLLLIGVQNEVAVLYVLCLAINAFVFIGSRISVYYLKKRDTELDNKEAAARQDALAAQSKSTEVEKC